MFAKHNEDGLVTRKGLFEWRSENMNRSRNLGEQLQLRCKYLAGV